MVRLLASVGLVRRFGLIHVFRFVGWFGLARVSSICLRCLGLRCLCRLVWGWLGLVGVLVPFLIVLPVWSLWSGRCRIVSGNPNQT